MTRRYTVFVADDGFACDSFSSTLEAEAWAALEGGEWDVRGSLSSEVTSARTRTRRYKARDSLKWHRGLLAYAKNERTRALFEDWAGTLVGLGGGTRSSESPALSEHALSLALVNNTAFGALRASPFRRALNCAAATYICGANDDNARGARDCDLIHARAFNDKDARYARTLQSEPRGVPILGVSFRDRRLLEIRAERRP